MKASCIRQFSEASWSSQRTWTQATSIYAASRAPVASLFTNATQSAGGNLLQSRQLLRPTSRRDIRTRFNAAAEEHSSAAEPADRSIGSSTSTQTAAVAASISGSSGSDVSGLSVLTSTEPIDRLRYQAMLVFDHWDAAKTGRLTGQQLEQFFSWCARKESWSPGLSEVLQLVSSSFAHLLDSGCSRDEFIRIVRQQVHAVCTSAAYQGSMMRADVAARLQTQMSLNKQEIAAAKWIFGLLDFDNDGKVSLSMYKDAEGIEAYVYDDKIEDADTNEDGQIVFEEFLGSYAKPKPIGKNVVIMAINTLVIFLILQAPFLETMLKVIIVGVLFARPQIISRPAAVLYDAFKAIIDQGKAQAELAKQSRGVWRPA